MTNRVVWLLAWVGVGASGCVTSDVGSISGAASQPGPWSIPADTRAIADSQYVAYDGAGAWVGTSGCGGSLLPGTSDLRYYLLAHFDEISSIGGYACRQNTANTSKMSVHGTGRALDIFIPLDGADADNDDGDPVGNWLIEHTEEIGVQYVIWDRWQWNASRASGDKDRMYTGPHPHHDHLHVEITEEAAARRTPWFSGPMAPPAEAPTVPSTCDAGTSYTPYFCDDDGHWAEVPIQYLWDEGLTYGCGEINGKPRFCPEQTATRAQAIVFIGRAAEMPTAGHPDAFDDDDGHFAEAYLNAAAAYDITRGCGTRLVCPNEDATRSHVAVFLVRAYDLPPATEDHFDDDDGSVFEDAHNRLAQASITSGCRTREFCGDEVVTRAMMATFIHRVHSRGLPTLWTPEPPMPTEETDPISPETMEEDAGASPADAGASSEPDAGGDGSSTGGDAASARADSGRSSGPDAGSASGSLGGGCRASGGSRPGGELAWLTAVLFVWARRRRSARR